MQLLVITYGAVGVYNHQVVVRCCMVLVMTIKLVYSHHNVVLTLISMVCPSLSGDGHASAMLLIIIIL